MGKTFGILKTYIEESLIDSYQKDDFKQKFNFFKTNILENKKMCEVFTLYDNLNESTNMNVDIVDEYIEIASKKLSKMVAEMQQEISKLVDSFDYEIENQYEDIDNIVYEPTPDKIVESVISKNEIKTKLCLESETKEKTHIDIPLSSMNLISAKAFNKEYSNLSESDEKELLKYLSLTRDELKEQFDETKNNLVKILEDKKNKDFELTTTINETLNVINSYDCNIHKLYRMDTLLKTLV